MSHILSERLWSRVVDQSDPFLDFSFSFPAEGKSIKAHRSTLLARSEFYKNKFLSGLSDASVQSSEISDFSFASFRAFLEFLYMENTVVTPETFGELLSLSDFYVVPELGAWLSDRITAGCFLLAVEAAGAIHHTAVLEKAKCIVSKMLPELSHPLFAGISWETVELVLGWTNLLPQKCQLLAMWASQNGEEAVRMARSFAVSKLQWERMTMPDFQKCVAPLSLFSDHEIKAIVPKLIALRDVSTIVLDPPRHIILQKFGVIEKMVLDPSENVIYFISGNSLFALDACTCTILSKHSLTHINSDFESKLEVYELAISSRGTIFMVASTSDVDGVVELSKHGEYLGVPFPGEFCHTAVNFTQKCVYLSKVEHENQIFVFSEEGNFLAHYELCDPKGKGVGDIMSLAVDENHGILYVSGRQGLYKFNTSDMSCSGHICTGYVRWVTVDHRTGMVLAVVWDDPHCGLLLFAPEGSLTKQISYPTFPCPTFGPDQELFVQFNNHICVL